MNILCTESFVHKKTYNRTLLFCSTPLKHGRHFDYRNQPLNMRMRVCYLDCHEAERCCYVHYSCFTSICDLFTDSPSYHRPPTHIHWATEEQVRAVSLLHQLPRIFDLLTQTDKTAEAPQYILPGYTR
jgi:hypothetical protein